MELPRQQTDSPRFRELQSPPVMDRRRSQRIRQPLHAEICEWHGNRAGAAFGVIVNDLSTTGVGILHNERFQVGAKYLIEIARPGQRPLTTLLTVVRCNQSNGGLFHVQLEPDDVLDVTVRASMRNAHPEKRSHALVAYVMLAIVLATLLMLKLTL